MTDLEKQQYSQRVERELFSGGISGAKNNLRRLNRELDADIADIRFNVNKGKIPEYIERNKLIEIQEKKEIIQAVYNYAFESSGRAKQVEIIKGLSDATGTEFLTIQKLFARLIAFGFVIVFWSVIFFALYIFAIKDSELGQNSLLMILGTVIAVIFIFEIAFSSERVSIIKPLYKISRFIYKVLFRQAFLILGGTEEELERIRRRRRHYSD